MQMKHDKSVSIGGVHIYMYIYHSFPVDFGRNVRVKVHFIPVQLKMYSINKR